MAAVDPSAADSAAGFTFRIDWNGDSIVDEVLEGPSGASLTHEFSRGGTYTVQVWAIDKDGGTSSRAVRVINVR